MRQSVQSCSTRANFSLRRLLLLCSSLILLDQNLSVQAQITPNGAGTVVNPQGNQINITGGTQAGASLFHSFRDFNVNSAQIANFLSNPQTQNILARINGGNPSLINGLLQVTGGSSNLFLMNPAGIVFGQGASLNVPASFTATTANQIGFGNNLFNAVGDNNFSALIGNPNSFVFNTTQAGSIVNAGNLAVGNGQNISLIAGNTINTGRLTAPGGEIQVLAVPGTNRVRLSQPGQVLSLEIVPPVDGTLRAIDLPALLTGNDLPGIQINPTGQVQVAGTTLPNQQGLAIASGHIDVSSNTGNGGIVQVLGNRVAALNSRINANGATGGGTVRLGGEYLGGRDTGIAPEFRFNSQRTLVDRTSLIRANATVTGEGGRVIVWADQNTGYFGRITGRGATGRGGFVEVSGRENLAFDGRVELEGFNGLGGSLLLDPANITIVAAGGNGDLSLPNILAATLPDPMTISAGALALIPVGTAINITASNSIDFQSDVTLINNGTAPVIFTAPTILASAGVVTFNSNGRNVVLSADTINTPDLQLLTARANTNMNGGNIQVTASTGNLTTGLLASQGPQPGGGNGGTITINALQGNITTGNTYSGSNNGIGGAIAINAPQGTINITGSIVSSSGNNGTAGNVNITALGNITSTSDINLLGSGGGGALNITSQSGNITSGNIRSFSFVNGNGGAVTINAPQGTIATGLINSSSANAGNGGAINFTALGNISSGSIENRANGANGNGGAVNLTSQGGNVTTGLILSTANNGNGGAVNLTSQGGAITSGDITNYSNNADGGTVTLNASQGNITAGNIANYANFSGTAGAVEVNARGNFTSGNINSYVGFNGTGGTVNVTARGNINSGNITTRVGNNGNSGSVTLNSPQGTIATGNIQSNTGTGTGGIVTITAPQGNITSGSIDSSVFTAGSGGVVTVNTTQGILVNGSISSRGNGVNNTSGTINMTAGNLVRVTGTCLAGVSICSAGQNNAGNGAVTIRHGGRTITPFIVGDSATNGTAGAINAGTGNIINTTFSVPVPPDTYTQGIVNIITNAPPPVIPPVVPPVVPPPTPSIDPALLVLLRNPTPPEAPAPVTVGLPPTPPPVIEPPTPAPIVTPIIMPVVVPPAIAPAIVPPPVAIIPPAPIPAPRTNPVLPVILEAIDPQDTRRESAPPSGTLTFITNPSGAEVLSILSNVLPFSSFPEIQNNLNQTSQTTGVKPAIIYAFFAPDRSGIPEQDTLEVILITEKGEPLRVQFLDTTRRQVLAVANRLRDSAGIDDPRFDRNAALQIYQWLMAPLERELRAQGINNLVFIGVTEFQGLPLGGLYDGQRFIRERYTISRP